MNASERHHNGTLLGTRLGRANLVPPVVMALLCFLCKSWGQGTMTITFEGPPPQPPGTRSHLATYSESGMLFVDGPDALVRVGSGVAGVPDNGTTYLGTGVNTTATVSSLSGVPFGLSSFDVARFFGLLTPATLQVIGVRLDGTTITNNFTPRGSSFQTLQLGSGFVNLNTVFLTGGFAFDNVVVGIPEPSAGALIVLAALSMLGSSRMREARATTRRF